jgi:hypothetical protein
MMCSGTDLFGGIVEVGEVAGADVHGADAQAHLARVDAVEVDQALERGAQRFGVVVAGGAEGRPSRIGLAGARCEEAGHALQQHASGGQLVEPDAYRIDEGKRGPLVADYAVAAGAHQFPEFAQARHPVLPGVAGDDGAVDGADRDPRHPGRLDAGFQQPFVDPGLVGAERAAALQHERDAAELGRTRLGRFVGCRCAFLEHGFSGPAVAGAGRWLLRPVCHRGAARRASGRPVFLCQKAHRLAPPSSARIRLAPLAGVTPWPVCFP